MALSTEAAISLAGILISLPPAVLAIWAFFRLREVKPATPPGTFALQHLSDIRRQLISAQVLLRDKLQGRSAGVLCRELPYERMGLFHS